MPTLTIDLKGLDKKINRVFHPLMNEKKRNLVLYGGAGSGKSVYACQKILYRIINEKNHKIAVIRKVAATQRNSCFALFKDIISDWGLNDLFTIGKSEMVIESKTLNSSIIFLGLDDPEKLKSISGITSIWVEEATELKQDEFKQVNLRLRGKTANYKQIILTFNPISILHWLKKIFFDMIRDDTAISKTTYLDNYFIDDDYKKTLEDMKLQDETFYDIYALGEWGVIGNLVYSNYVVEDLKELKDTFNSYYNGLDFGYSKDPSAYIRVAFHNKKIYILDELYEKCLTNDILAKKLLPVVDRETVYCDSSEPKSIQELKDNGINSIGVKKGPRSVLKGIEWIRQYQIIIDKRCQNFINEIQCYKYRESKDGSPMHDPVDIDNHLMDALRYALECMMHTTILEIPSFKASNFGF